MQPADPFEKSTATAQEERALYAEQVRQLYGNARVGLFATVINALILAFIQRDVTLRINLIVWITLIAVVSLLRY